MLPYNTLRSRIRQYMRAGYEQTPRIHAPLDPEKALNGGVFNQRIPPQQTISEAIFTVKKRWQLNVGAIHGVGEKTSVTLTDPTNASRTFPVTVRKGGVFVDYTELADTDAPNPKLVYDEIHPTNEGFQLVANKFIAEIERVRAKKPAFPTT